MDFYSQIHSLETNRNWKDALVLLEERVRQHKEDVEASIRLLFLLWYLLLEEDYEAIGLSAEVLEEKLRGYFQQTRQLHSSNSDYLFFVGDMMQLTEWYFETPQCQNVVKEAHAMIRQAVEMNPSNLLYQWGYHLIVERDSKAKEFALLIQERLRSGEFDELSNRGLLGSYFTEMVNASVD